MQNNCLKTRLKPLPFALFSIFALTAFAEEVATLPVIKVMGTAETGGYLAVDSASVSRSALPLLDTPVAVQVVSTQVMEDQQAEKLGDVLRNVSGVSGKYDLGGAYERFVIRGFEQSPTTYRNGIQLPFQQFEMANTERVEILKGASAAEYGMSDPGGVINIVTKSPVMEPAYYVGQRVGSDAHYRTEAGATGAINAQAGLSYRIDASYLNTESYRELADTKNYFVAPSLRWQMSPDTRINLGVELMKGTEIYDGGVPAVGSGFASLPIERSFAQKGLEDTHKNRLLDLNLEHRLNPNWTLSGGFLSHANSKDYRSFYAYANNLNTPADVMADRYAWFGPERFNTKTGWLNLTGEFDAGTIKHHFLSGIQYSKLHGRAAASETYVDTINLSTFTPSQSNVNLAAFENLPPDFIADQDDSALGFFVQDQIQITDRLNLIAALRHDAIKRELESAYFSPLLREERKDSQWSPRLGVLYKITPAVSTYASYSESFGPGFNYEPSNLYEPEQAKQFEVGVKAKLMNGKLSGSATLFDLTKRNIPTPDPNNPFLNVAIGAARSRGLELDIQGRLTPALNVIASYAYTETRITRDFSGNQGNRLPNAPTHQGSVWLKYAFQSKALRGLSIGSGVYAASQRYGDVANSYGDGAYTRIDLSSAYQFKCSDALMTARLNVENVTNERYYLMRARWTNLPAAPRTLLASLRADF